MIEDELRSLLTERAGGVPGNPTRSAEVRSRIGAVRRHRVAGAALGLVLLALVSLLVLRLPGSNESLPPAVPAPPYFDAVGRPAVVGYSWLVGPRDLTGPLDDLGINGPGEFRALVVARCEQRGTLTVRNSAGPTAAVACTRRVGDHFEGITALTPSQLGDILEQHPPRDLYPGGYNVRYEPGSAGSWVVAILTANDPDRLRPWSDPGSRALVEGSRYPDGTTVEITIPGVRGPEGYDALDLSVECVAGVRIAFSVPAGDLGVADCDPLRRNHMMDGRVGVGVARAELARLGLRVGQRVPLTIRSVGRDTDQWRVLPID